MAAPADADSLTVEPSNLEDALRREQGKIKALQEVGLALGSTLDLDELLALVLDRISQVMDADRSTLYLLDEESGDLWSKIAQGRQIQEIRLRVGEGLAGWVAKTGRALNIRDAYQDVRFDAEWDRRTGYRTRSILCVPMKNHHGRTIGVVQVLNKRTGSFSVEDEHLLSALASQAAVSIENSKLFLSVVRKNMELLETKEQLERKIREQDVLFEIAQVSASATKLGELIEGVLARALRAAPADAASILLADRSPAELWFREAAESDAETRVTRVAGDEGICGWVAHHGLPQIVRDTQRDERYSKSIESRLGYAARAVLCVPLRWEGGIGSLELLKGDGREGFTDDDLKLATMIAGHVSTAVGLARNREQRARQERLSTIGQFLSSVLHDLKTPMTVISGYVQLLVNEDRTAVREAYGETILRQVELLNTMTRETLAFAKGDRTLWIRKVYLYRFFEEIAEQLRRDFGHRNITIDLALEDRGIGRFDQHKLQRAVHNIARNAAEAIGERGGRFGIRVSRRPDDGALVLDFTDDGPGISEEIRDRLFESFASHGKTGGTGLGLAIVRKIVEDHGGSIQVDSEPGRTCFRVVLPQPLELMSEPPHAAISGETHPGDDRDAATSE